MKSYTIILLAIIAGTFAEDLPRDFRTCKRSDPKLFECLADAGRDAIISMANGIRSLKILPLEPLFVNNIDIGELNGPVSVKQNYRNMELHGLTKGIHLHHLHFDWDKLILTFNIDVPRLELIADYKLNGRLLLIPLRGEGKCNITLSKLRINNKIHFEKFEQNEETYLKGTKYFMEFKPRHLNIYLGNLFDGDLALGDQMNKFMNENSELIFKELTPSFEETFSLIFLKITNDIFLRVPMDKIFPPT